MRIRRPRTPFGATVPKIPKIHTDRGPTSEIQFRLHGVRNPTNDCYSLLYLFCTNRFVRHVAGVSTRNDVLVQYGPTFSKRRKSILVVGTASQKGNQVVRFLQFPSLCDQVALQVLFSRALTEETDRVIGQSRRFHFPFGHG